LGRGPPRPGRRPPVDGRRRPGRGRRRGGARLPARGQGGPAQGGRRGRTSRLHRGRPLDHRAHAGDRVHHPHREGPSGMTATVPATVEHPSFQLRPARTAATVAFVALLRRDLRVLRKTIGTFAVRTIMQPLLLVFVFTYVFPKIGEGIGGSARGQAAFSTLLMAGVVATTMVFQGVQAVALPLVQEFGFTKEIEDRVMAPLPVWAVGAEKL